MQDAYLGCLFGLAVGDAIGTSVEFRYPGTFEPVTDMLGGGAFNLKAGEWTDDTSMALCLAQSLLSRKGFDPQDQMQRYLAWRHSGYMSSNGECFDIGNTTSAALDVYEATGEPYVGLSHSRSAGNGSIMRLAPIPMYFIGSEDLELHAANSSKTTHAHPDCIAACIVLSNILKGLLLGDSKEYAIRSSITGSLNITNKIKDIVLNKTYVTSTSIAGTGYVVESLEAALWAFTRGSSFKECVLLAVNLGNDADTTAAVTGQLAGAFYGYNSIPEQWVSKIAKFELIERIASELFEQHK